MRRSSAATGTRGVTRRAWGASCWAPSRRRATRLSRRRWAATFSHTSRTRSHASQSGWVGNRSSALSEHGASSASLDHVRAWGSPIRPERSRSRSEARRGPSSLNQAAPKGWWMRTFFHLQPPGKRADAAQRRRADAQAHEAHPPRPQARPQAQARRCARRAAALLKPPSREVTAGGQNLCSDYSHWWSYIKSIIEKVLTVKS